METIERLKGVEWKLVEGLAMLRREVVEYGGMGNNQIEHWAVLSSRREEEREW